MTVFSFAARRRAFLAGLVVACSCVLLAGCSSIEDLFVDPGKYEVYNCDQIAAQGKAAAQRERELKGLMSKASEGAAGGLVNTMAYRSEYLSALGQLKQLEQMAVEKKCETPWLSSSDRATW